MDLDVTLLSFVREIGRTRSFSAAARELGYSQAAVSQRIRRLEAALGLPLFVRRPRGVDLTEAGEVLLRRGVEALATIELAEQEVHALSAMQAGRVRIVAFPSMAATALPLAIADLAEAHPDLVVSFKEEHPPEAIGSIRAATADIAIVYRYEDPATDHARRGESLVVHALLSDPLYVAMPAGHKLAQRGSVKLEDLSSETWIARNRVSNVFSELQHLGFSPKPGPEISDSVAAQAFVARGLGIAVMPRLVIHASHHPGIVVKPLLPRRNRAVEALTLSTTPEIPSVAATLEALRQACDRLGELT
jgi:DNA-binding transcriptional LysR family regulator